MGSQCQVCHQPEKVIPLTFLMPARLTGRHHTCLILIFTGIMPMNIPQESNLKPYITHTVQFITQLARSYTVTARFSHAVNTYDFVSELSATGDSIISRPVNVSKNTSYTLNASTSQQVFPWWRLAVHANMTFSDVHTQTYGRTLTSYILISANNMFYLENDWGLSLG